MYYIDIDKKRLLRYKLLGQITYNNEFSCYNILDKNVVVDIYSSYSGYCTNCSISVLILSGFDCFNFDERRMTFIPMNSVSLGYDVKLYNLNLKRRNKEIDYEFDPQWGTVANNSDRYEANLINSVLRYLSGVYCKRIRVTYRGKIVWKFSTFGLKDTKFIYMSSDEKDCVVIAEYERKKRKPYMLYYMRNGEVINTYGFDAPSHISRSELLKIIFSDEIINWIKAQGVILCQ